MHTVRRTQALRRGRHVRTLTASATAAAALVLTGLTAAAQALPTTSARATSTKSVPAGVATAVNLTACPSGTPTVTSVPAQPNSAHVAVSGTKSKLIGVWPTSPTSYAITIKCSGGATENVTLTIQAAPPENSAIGLGAQTQQSLLDQFSADYNATHTTSGTQLYYFDATNPITGAMGDTIVTKHTSTDHTTCSVPRPDGASAGIIDLINTKTLSGHPCIDFAGNTRARASTDPTTISFITLGGDAISYTTQPHSNAPAALTDADLAAIGVTTVGPCVSTDNNTLEENEGVNPVLQTPEAIWIYSVGDYIAQRFHSPACTNSGCTGTPPCAPAGGKDDFGCNVHGTYVPKDINGIAPTTGTGAATKINTSFPSTFLRTLFAVVPYDPNTSDHIPGSESGAPGGVNLEAIFGASGWACTNSTAKTDIKNYGFVTLGTCGATS